MYFFYQVQTVFVDQNGIAAVIGQKEEEQ